MIIMIVRIMAQKKFTQAATVFDWRIFWYLLNIIFRGGFLYVVYDIQMDLIAFYNAVVISRVSKKSFWQTLNGYRHLMLALYEHVLWTLILPI